MVKIRESVLALTKGWDRDRVRQIVRETSCSSTVEPLIYAEALELMASHHLAGQRVYLVSASPEEIVLPMAELLGADGTICSRAEVDDDGRYTGRMAFFADGPHKAEAITELAETLEPRPRRVDRLLGLGDRCADARARRATGRGQRRPGAGQGGPRAWLGDVPVHEAGATPRPGRHRGAHGHEPHARRARRSPSGCGAAGGRRAAAEPETALVR